MTDTSSLAITHATTDPYPVPAPLDSPVNGAISDSGAPDEEEPYTIKCICQFNEDDGSTVFCERCETWQHIVCYYPDKRVPDVHNCIECEPRQLDSRRAADRQRQRRIREQSEDGDRRKRSSAKATKKKPKDGDMNGFGHQRSQSGARDQPPAKKTKTSHRSSTSIGALSGAPHLPTQSRKRRSSTSLAPSPPKLSGPSIPLYSNEFLHLYDGDEDHVDMDSNLFVNVSLVGESASWVKNPDALARVTNGRRAEDTFIRSDAALDRSRWPALTTDTITDSNIEISGRHPTWKIVKTQDTVRKDEVVGEITGKVGIFDDYCLDPNNRWSELRHPEPFVFFSSHLPLYIDSRYEGSMLRYTRRSCRPNVTMKIFITNDVEYHFCFVAKEDIPAGSEITIMWYLDAQMSESSNGLVKQESGDSATDAAAVCISNTLANFGGCACACEHPQNCLLANIDRRRHPKSLETPKQTNGKRRKANIKPGKSPLDARRGSTSRAGSETTKHTEDDDAAVDSRSTSGSVRKSLSRDLSPTASNPGLAGLGMSSRERRKIADAEKQFQALENDQRTTAQKKKKRTSAPSAHSPAPANSTPSQTTSSQTTSSQTSFFASQRGYGKMLPNNNIPGDHPQSPNTGLSPGSLPAARNATSRGTSGSNTPRLRPYRSNYVDLAIQCDRDSEDTPPFDPTAPRWVHPKVRLLQRYYADCRRARERAREQLESAGSDSVDPGESVSPWTQSPNVAMANADAGVDTAQTTAVTPSAIAGNSESDINRLDQDPSKPPISPPWPSTAAHNTRLPGSTTPINHGTLRVSMPPPSVPAIPPAISPGSASTASLASPSTVEASSPRSAQIPAAPTPTPAKRKLTLGDYLSRRGTLSTPTLESSPAHAPAAAAPPAPNPPTNPAPGHAASADDAQAPTNPPLDNNTSDTKVETPQPSEVAMKDASDSAKPHDPSTSQ
ncbi:hypothetical protein N7486_010050 [Penicillium sp. IBT 16267x]|nr:hypothetical protein N7486_010050 [Penicillium sp. IBT 16267x]